MLNLGFFLRFFENRAPGQDLGVGLGQGCPGLGLDAVGSVHAVEKLGHKKRAKRYGGK